MGGLVLNAAHDRQQPDDRDRIIRSLKEENADLQEQVVAARRELDSRNSNSERAVAELRRQLSPLYQALRAVFGEIDAIVPEDDTYATHGQSSGNGRERKWEAIKQRLQPRMREAIDILLMQGSMKRTQLAAALKMDYSNCAKNVISVLIRQGWLIDNGSNLSLKEL